MPNLTCSLKLPSPFSIKWVTAHVRTSSYGVPYTILSGNRLRRLMKPAGSLGLVDYDFDAGGKTDRLHIAVRDAADTTRFEENKIREIRSDLKTAAHFIFGFDDDLKRCYTVLRRTPELRAMVKRYRGLRIVKTPDLYESLLITILGQQVSVASAQSQRRRLMETFGRAICIEDQTYLSMPEPDRLADAGEKGLRSIGVSRQKTRYLLEIAGRIADGRLDRPGLMKMSCEAAMERLMEIPGVGRWTAEIAAMRGLGFQDVFPAGDLGLQVAAQKAFGMTDRPTEKELRDLARQWEGWRSYAAFYLWMTLMEGGYA